MKLIEKKLEEIILNSAKELYSGIEDIKMPAITSTSNEKFGDYQTNFAMINSKKIGKNPREIASNIVESIKENAVIEKLEIAGPGFINIFLKDEFLAENLNKIFKEDYDFDFLDREGDIIIDYSSPNIAKRMHIGHLRSTIIGDAIKSMYKYLGYNVVADNHIGDWGTQFGKLIIAYRNWLDKEAYAENAINELERIYVKFSQEAENDKSLDDQAREELKKLHEGSEENMKLWKEFIKVSLDEYNKVYERLGISFDTYYGESHYHNMMPGILELLKEKGLAVESEGAQVVFFDESENLYPCIVQKKDGAFLYSTSDLACIKFRKENYNLNKLIYVTDERQQDHFKQFFNISDKLGWEVKKDHVWFGIMRFEDGIFSTRKGNVIKLEDLVNEGKKRAYDIVNEKNPELSEEEKDQIAEAVGIGAVKYADLSQNKESPIIFKWDKILSFEGNTAPYLQYSYARIKSILRKAKEEGKYIKGDITILKEKQEKALSLAMLRFPNAVLKASETYRPNILAEYIYDLAKKFNSFYNAVPILREEGALLESRLRLAELCSELIKEGLGILGINTVERM